MNRIIPKTIPTVEEVAMELISENTKIITGIRIKPNVIKENKMLLPIIGPYREKACLMTEPMVYVSFFLIRLTTNKMAAEATGNKKKLVIPTRAVPRLGS